MGGDGEWVRSLKRREEPPGRLGLWAVTVAHLGCRVPRTTERHSVQEVNGGEGLIQSVGSQLVLQESQLSREDSDG